MAQTPPSFARPVKNAVYDVNTATWVPMTQPGAAAAGGGDASAANQVTGNASLASIDGKTPALGQALAAASTPVVLTAAQLATLTPPAAITGYALEAGNLASIKAKTDNIPAPGQALAAASTPVVLTAIQVAALTPPAAIAGFALEAGHLAAIDTATAKIPSQGQALASASTPVVLPAAQITTLTPPAAITGYALEAGHLAAIDTATAKIPAQGQALASASLPVVLTAAQIATLTPPTTVGVTAEPTYGGKTITYVPVNQASAGTTQLAAADATKKHKVLGIILTMSATGTLKFTDGTADLLGPCDVGTTGGFVAPTSMIPYTETGAVNRALNLTTTVGAARGVVVVLTEA